jgi:hypothetical protein
MKGALKNIRGAGNRQLAVEELPSLYHFSRIGQEPNIVSPGTDPESLETAPSAAIHGCYGKGDKKPKPMPAMNAPAGYSKGNVGMRQEPAIVTESKTTAIILLP